MNNRKIQLQTPYRRTNKQTYTEEDARNDPDLPEGNEVNPSGWMPPALMIKMMQENGERLQAMREELYHFKHGSEVDLGLVDPVHEPNFDLADGAALLNEQTLKQKIKQQNIEEARKITELKRSSPSDDGRYTDKDKPTDSDGKQETTSDKNS